MLCRLVGARNSSKFNLVNVMIGRRCYSLSGRCNAQMPCGHCTYTGLCRYSEGKFNCESCRHKFICFTNTAKDASIILRKGVRAAY